MAMVNMNNLLNGKDSRWLQLEVCREFQRNKCTRPDTECKFAHPPANVEVQNGRVTACYDSIKVTNHCIIEFAPRSLPSPFPLLYYPLFGYHTWLLSVVLILSTSVYELAIYMSTTIRACYFYKIVQILDIEDDSKFEVERDRGSSRKNYFFLRIRFLSAGGRVNR